MDYKITYIIGTYAGEWMKTNPFSKKMWSRNETDNETNLVLQKHMKALCHSLKTTTYIRQVTIIKNGEAGGYPDYYDINDYITEIEKLDVEVVILTPELLFGSSYSQYLYIYDKYPDFDFYIVMEDDWIPFPEHKNFDQTLLNEYKKTNYNGFLSAWVSTFRGRKELMPRHSVISVGIISNPSMKQAYNKALDTCPLNTSESLINWPTFDPGNRRRMVDDLPSHAQLSFSGLFEELSDYSNKGEKYLIPFWQTSAGHIIEYALHLPDSPKYLLVPLQLMEMDKYKYMVGDHTRGNNPRPSREIVQWVNDCVTLKKIKMKMTCCLVIVFYQGKRDGDQEKLFDKYIGTHLNLYTNIVKHNLDSIYFVINTDNLLKEKIVPDLNNPKIKYYYRNNKNLSFGGWVDVINKTNYDYYILCEDDYMFIKNDFDTILIQESKKYNADYHVLWKALSVVFEEKDGDPEARTDPDLLIAPPGLICTIGIISKKNSKLICDYNSFNSQHSKGRAMVTFLSCFNRISYTRNTIFPYYHFDGDYICLYINNQYTSKDSLDTYNKIISIINGTVPNPNNIISPILACYQYVEKYHPEYLRSGVPPAQQQLQGRARARPPARQQPTGLQRQLQGHARARPPARQQPIGLLPLRTPGARQLPIGLQRQLQGHARARPPGTRRQWSLLEGKV